MDILIMDARQTRAYLCRLIAVVLASSCALVASAAQRIEVQDSATSMGKISLKEVTRLKVDGGSITDVVGNVYHREKNPTGEIVVDEDKQRGEIFLSMPTPQTKPINLFIVTATATYTLLLHPVDIPSDTIVLVDRNKRIASASKPVPPGPLTAIKNLMASMATDRVSSSIRVSEENIKTAYISGMTLTLLRRYETGDLIGERYLLVNVGSRAQAIIEQSFYEDNVFAVSIDKLALLPNETTSVYVVRQATESRR